MEPMINRILADISTTSSSSITAHYTRIRVTQISDNGATASQFTLETMLDAAALLADAKVAAIVWGGTSAGWLGLENDRKLCAAIEARFQIPASTSTLALIELLRRLKPEDCLLGLVTPYKPELNKAIRENFASSKIVVAPNDACLSITDNHAISIVDDAKLTSMVDHVVSTNHDLTAVTVFCTNLSAAHLAKQWELKHQDQNLFVMDSISTTVYGALQKAGVAMQGRIASSWGKMFDIEL